MASGSGTMRTVLETLSRSDLACTIRMITNRSRYCTSNMQFRNIRRHECCKRFLGTTNRPFPIDICPHSHTSRPLLTTYVRPEILSNMADCASYSTSQKDVPQDRESQPDPYQLVEAEMTNFDRSIRQELSTEEPLLSLMSHYYFNGKGKAFRPIVVFLMSKACNIQSDQPESILPSQKVVAMIAEMIHTASLVHDDVIDASDTRRGQESLNKIHGQRRSILTGDYILSQASIALARTHNNEVISVLSSVLEDLVSGEFMQLGSKENENERFSHYLKKTYKKSASLIANTCKAVAILAGCNEEMSECAFQYGKNLGLAFQLIDDLLDFTASESAMGKPTAADLKLGLATAPVLFAAQEHPELHPMIMRRFSEEGDVEKARSLVAKSNGVEQTRLLAARHSKEAVRNAQQFATSPAQKALIRMAHILLERKK